MQFCTGWQVPPPRATRPLSGAQDPACSPPTELACKWKVKVVNEKWKVKVKAYILKAGFAGFQNPQTIWNFPQKDCLRTRKISILQYVRNKGEEASSNTKVCVSIKSLRNASFEH